MWQDNEDGTFTAEQGDTLWDLYGTDWQEKSGYEGDPTKLQIGDVVGKKRETYDNWETYSGPSQIPSKKQGLQGDIFLTLEADFVGIFGVEGSLSAVVDLDHFLESGINVSGGLAAGANVGIGFGFGYVRGDIEGNMPLGIDGNFGFLPVSGALYTDSKGISGGSLSFGPGMGLSVSSQNSKTLSLQSIINFFKRK
jgi:hypothetical protein